MRFHYALVDDILSREEFDRRVEETIASYGNAIDETAASLLVVEGAGRSHQKIGAITPSPSLVSFFGRIVSIREPKEFTRDDGSTGCVARIDLADETGTVPVVLWDEMAAGVGEVEEDTVLEVIGRPKMGRRTEVHALAVRESAVLIQLSGRTERSIAPGSDIDARVLAIEPPRSFTRKDGDTGTIQEAIIGDSTGCARLVTWDPAHFNGLSEGSSISIQGATRRSSEEGVEYLANEETRITVLDQEINILFTPADKVLDQGTYSVRGRITTLHPPRSFTTRRGDPSWVRNLFIEGGLRIVIWGERARDSILSGEIIEVYNAGARLNRYGDVELSVGFQSAVRVIHESYTDREIEGVIVLSPEGLAISGGDGLYILEGPNLPLASRFRLKGRLSGRRFIIDSAEPIHIDPAGDGYEGR